MNHTTDRVPYRCAYVTQHSSHDFTELNKLCERIVFLTTGYETENELLDVIITGLQNFEPARDLIVPVGNVAANMLVGFVLPRLFMKSFSMALYEGKEYHVRVVSSTLPDVALGVNNG